MPGRRVRARRRRGSPRGVPPKPSRRTAASLSASIAHCRSPCEVLPDHRGVHVGAALLGQQRAGPDLDVGAARVRQLVAHVRRDRVALGRAHHRDQLVAAAAVRRVRRRERPGQVGLGRRRHPAGEGAVDVDRRVLAGEGLLQRLERRHRRSFAATARAAACWAAAAAMLASTRANAPLWAANALRRPTSASRSSAAATARSATGIRAGTAGGDGEGATDGEARSRGWSRRRARRDAYVVGHRVLQQVDVRLVGGAGQGQRRLQVRVPLDGGDHPVEQGLLLRENGCGEGHVGVDRRPGCDGRAGPGATVEARRRAARDDRGGADQADPHRRTPGQVSLGRGGRHAPRLEGHDTVNDTSR